MFTFRQVTCLNFHLPRLPHATMPPHRLVQAPSRLKMNMSVH